MRSPGRFLRMLLAAVCLVVSQPTWTAPETGRVDLPRFPSLSPDGEELVFSWGGDLWLASVSGGEARRLTRHSLDDLHSSWSPDGQWLTFSSMRDGYMNLWRINRDGTQLEQLTYSDRFIRYPDVHQGQDGEPVITFSSLLEADVYREQRPYQLSAEGGDFTRLHDAFGSEPRVSPDGNRIVFTRGGYYHDWPRRHYRGPDAMNIWLYDREDESFEAFTERDGDDGSAQWAGDDSLVFMSDRHNETVNLFRADPEADSDEADRLTDFDGRDVLNFDVSQDGRKAVMQVWDTLYTLDLTDSEATPQAVSLRAGDDRDRDYELRRINREVTEAALSPDGETMAYIAYGRVYVRHMDEYSPTRSVTPGSHARHRDLAWSPDGGTLFFTSDQDGTESIYGARVALTRSEIRASHGMGGEFPGAVVMPSEYAESGDATESVTESSGQVNDDAPEPGSGADPDDPFAPVDPGQPMVDPAADPDPMASDPEPADDPEPAAEEPEPEDKPDRLPSPGDPGRWHDAVSFDVAQVVKTKKNDREASPSPDGRYLVFRRGRGDLVVKDRRTEETRTLVEGWDSQIHWRWSPDGRHIAYAQNDLNFSSNIFVVPVDGSRDPVNITRHPRNDRNPRWSADGRKLSFISNRSGENYDLYRVYLDPALEQKGRREQVAYYRDARRSAEKTKPLTLTGESRDVIDSLGTLRLEDAFRRTERVSSSPRHQTGNEMTPGGDRYVFNSAGEGLIVMNWDGSERRRLGPAASVQQLSLSGDRAVVVHGGRVAVVKLDNGDVFHPDIEDRIRIDLAKQSRQKFREAARVIEEGFYRPDMKGLDWPALVDEYEGLISRTRTPSEFSDVINRMLGELSASHMGVNNPGPASERREPSGRLGIQETRVELDGGYHGYRVDEVVPGSPADRGALRLQQGDIITGIELQPFEAEQTLLRRLRGHVGEEVIVSFRRPTQDGHERMKTLITPIDYGELSQLRYDDFRERSRQRVHELSDGRLGYIHIQSMNQTSLEEFQGDLYAAAYGKDGLIIDVRNNGGGSTTDRILTSIMAEEHAYTVPAGADPSQTGHYPQDRLDAPRYTLSINMLANEKSYSNAEILAHAFSTLDRGTLVGEQTYGGVISTGSHRLIDGATVRRPFRGWYLPDGTDMEHHGAKPDIRVTQTPEDEIEGRDRQLERAVEDMLERID